MARFQDDLVYYSFTMSFAQSGSALRLRILAECVREASPAVRFQARDCHRGEERPRALPATQILPNPSTLS
jgi:hypothetical protein